MGVLSLRLVAVLICVFLTLATALVTLMLSLTFTKKAVDSIGLQHTGAMLKIVHLTLQNYFQGMVSDYLGISLMISGRSDDLPNNTWANGFAFAPGNYLQFPYQSLSIFDPYVLPLQGIMAATNYSRDISGLMCFADGSYIMSAASSFNGTALGYMQITPGRGNAPVSVTTTAYTRNFVAATGVSFARRPATNGTSLAGFDCRLRPYFYNGPTRCVWQQPYVSLYTSLATGIYCSLTNTNGLYLGSTGNMMTLDQISTFVKQLNRTANSHAFVVDTDSMQIVATTHPAKFQTSTKYNATLFLNNGQYNGTLEPGCTAGTLSPNFIIICQKTVDQFGYAPLAAVQGAIGATADAPAVGTADVNGDTYYYATATVATYDSNNVGSRRPIQGLTLAAVILLPQDDIIGEVIEGRTYSIIGAACVFVVASVASFVAFTLFLRPLDRLQEQMEETAKLQDSSEKEDISALSEIGSMQKAFYTMRAQLKKIKSYVPQSVLATLVDDDEDEERLSRATGSCAATEISGGRNEDAATRVSGKSNRSSKSIASASGSVAVSTRSLNLSNSVAKRKITVLAFNVRSFHGYVSDNGGDAVAASLSHLVESVSHSVSMYRGIVDSFHGDHIIATFNAVNNNPQHAVRAGITALDIIHQIKSNAAMASRFPHVTIGIATGEAIVGNMGTDSLKRFCSIGPVYTQALVLERLAKQYAPHEVLISNASAVEMQYEFYYEVLDVVPLPGSTRPTLVAALVGRKAFDANRDSEWMYTMQKGNDGDAFGVTNAAFLKYVSDDAAGAQTFLATIPADDSRTQSHGYRNLTGMLHTPLATHVTRQGTYYTSSFLPSACPLE